SGAGDTAAQRVARGVLDALAEPFVVAGQALPIEASMGIVIYPRRGEDGDTLLRRADIAMYVAKRSGSSAVECAPASDQHPQPRRSGAAPDGRRAARREPRLAAMALARDHRERPDDRSEARYGDPGAPSPHGRAPLDR